MGLTRIECVYKDKCSDYPNLCSSCRHNTTKKKSYYEPENYIPVIKFSDDYHYNIDWDRTSEK